MPCVKERQTHLAVRVKIRIEPGASIICEILEDRWLKGIIRRETHFEAEGPAIIRRAFGSHDDGVTESNFIFTGNPEEALVCQIHCSRRVADNAVQSLNRVV